MASLQVVLTGVSLLVILALTSEAHPHYYGGPYGNSNQRPVWNYRPYRPPHSGNHLENLWENEFGK